MATPPMPIPAPPMGGAGAAPQGPAPAPAPSGAPPQMINPAFALIFKITQDAQAMAAALPETSPMAEEIQNQVRLALQKAIQGQAPQQQAPPI